ncbi:hypothetical protein ABBQ32_008048 [Trebouxia sp. C0010 RCD-2024]
MASSRLCIWAFARCFKDIHTRNLTDVSSSRGKLLTVASPCSRCHNRQARYCIPLLFTPDGLEFQFASATMHMLQLCTRGACCLSVCPSTLSGACLFAFVARHVCAYGLALTPGSG